MLTLSDLRLAIATDADDLTLSRLLAAAVAAVESVTTPAAGRWRVLRPLGRREISRTPQTLLLDVREQETLEGPETSLIATSDYRILGGLLLRVGRTWGAVVSLLEQTIIPADERDRVIIALVQLDLSADGYLQTSDGTLSTVSGDLSARRDALLHSIASRGALLV